MKKTSIIILVIIAFIFVSCTKQDTQLEVAINNIEECISNDNRKITEKDASFSYHASTATLIVNKFLNFYACEGEIKISATIKDKTILIAEQTESNTNCKCPKNISYTISNIPSGSYKISINSKIIGEVLVY